MMKLNILSFIGCILLFSFHFATPQPLEDDNNVSGLGDLLKPGDYPTLNSLHKTNIKRKNGEENQNRVKPKLPQGYTEFSNKNKDFVMAYKFNRTKVTWNQARKTCQQEGAFLGFPDSAKEARRYRHILKHLDDGGAWIGLHDLFEEGDWVTVLGEKVKKLKYVNWALTEPNNYRHNENCAEMYDKDGKWYDTSCDKKLFFICKIFVNY